MASQGDLVLKIKADTKTAHTNIDKLRQNIVALNAALVHSKTHMSVFTNSAKTMSNALATQLNQKLSMVNVKLDSLAAKSNKASSALGRTSANMRQVGRDMTFLLSLPAGLAIRGMTRAFLDFDDAMAKSLAKFREVNSGMREMAEKRVRALAEEYGIATDKVAASMKQLGQAGLSFDAALKVLPKALAFAKASGAQDVEHLVDQLTDAVTALGRASKDPLEMGMAVQSMSDMITRGSNISTATMGQLLDSVTNQGAGMAKVLQISQEELVAFFATMASTGVKGRKAGNQMAQMFINLAAASSKNKEAFQKHLPIFDQTTGKMKPMADIISTLSSKLKDLSPEERIPFLKDTLGLQIRSSKVVQQLIGLEGQYAEALEEVSNSQGATANMARKMSDSVRERLTKAFITLKNALVDVGKTMSPVFEVFAKIVKFVAKVISGMNGTLKVLMTVGTAVAAVGGPLWMIINIVSSLKKAFTGAALSVGTFSKAFGKFATGGLILGAIALVANLTEQLAEFLLKSNELDDHIKASQKSANSIMEGKSDKELFDLFKETRVDVFGDLRANTSVSENILLEAIGKRLEMTHGINLNEAQSLENINKMGKIIDGTAEIERERNELAQARLDKAKREREEAEKTRKANVEIIAQTKELLRMGMDFKDVSALMGGDKGSDPLYALNSIMDTFKEKGGILGLLGMEGQDNELESKVASIFAKHGIVGDKLNTLLADAAWHGFKPALVKAMGAASGEVVKTIEGALTMSQKALIDRQLEALQKRIKAIKERQSVTAAPTAKPSTSFDAVKTGTVEAYKLLFGLGVEDDRKEQKQLSIDQLNELRRLNKQTAELKKRKGDIIVKIN